MTFPSTTASVARTDAGQTFTGTQIMTSPKILTSILDTNGNTMVRFGTAANAVNSIEIDNASSSNPPNLSPVGTDGNIDIELFGKGTGRVLMGGGVYQIPITSSPGAGGTATIDLSQGNEFRVTMPAGNATIAVSNANNGQRFIVSITQDSGGSRTVTWFTTIRWANGTAPTLTTTANKRDTFGFICTGTNTYDGYIIGQNI
jgi:hypothetical protein